MPTGHGGDLQTGAYLCLRISKARRYETTMRVSSTGAPVTATTRWYRPPLICLTVLDKWMQGRMRTDPKTVGVELSAPRALPWANA